jgi:tRNA-dihydrouridine synthase B
MFTFGNIQVMGDRVLAPMDGLTDFPSRQIAKPYGAAIIYSEFINGLEIQHGHPYLEERLMFLDNERPFGYQIFDDNPERLFFAAKHLQTRLPDFIDLNLGCSVKRVVNRGAGAGLLKDLKKIESIMRGLASVSSVPITAKIRLGWDQEHLNFLEIAKIIEDNGGAMIAVHARSRDQSYNSPVNWDAIAAIKQTVSIPVIGNGNVTLSADVDRMKAETGCDAVMIGRASIGNPWVFSGIDKSTLSADTILSAAKKHLVGMTDFYGERIGVAKFRKHLVHYMESLNVPASHRLHLLTAREASDIFDGIDALILHLLPGYQAASSAGINPSSQQHDANGG